MSRSAFVLLGAIAAVLAAASPEAAAQAPARTPLAVLARGNGWAAGIPGFGANALPCVYGEYSVGAGGWTGRAWLTDEPLLFGPAWKPRRLGAFVVLERAARGGPAGADGEAALSADGAFRLAAADRPFPAGGRGASPERWSLVVAVPEDVDPAEADRFARALLERTGYFLSGAASGAEVSLPAVIDR